MVPFIAMEYLAQECAFFSQESNRRNNKEKLEAFESIRKGFNVSLKEIGDFNNLLSYKGEEQ